MEQRRDVIAIDGPAASGKTTVASLLAKRLGYLYINTGAMYRALALKAARAGVQCTDPKGIEALLESTEVSFRRKPDGSTVVILDGEDVSEPIKTQEIAHAASVIARLLAVRRYLVSRQRRIATEGNAVAEGRDTTTVVFPETPHKFYVDASLEERAKRRHRELAAKASPVSLEEVQQELEERDVADRNRELSPLTKDRDAVLIDSTDLSPEEVVTRIEAHLARAGEGNEHPPSAGAG
jgi:cytidylate kinase